MPITRLYSQDLNPFTEKVICGLALKGLDYTRIEVSIDRLRVKRRLCIVLEPDRFGAVGDSDHVSSESFPDVEAGTA